MLENENPEIDEPDIGILKFSDLYNLRLQRNHSDFLSRVGFVFIVEPSRLLASGQAGVSLLVHRFDESKEPVVYAACDRNCDGLVDACLLYTSDAADEEDSVDLGGRRDIKKKNNKTKKKKR